MDDTKDIQKAENLSRFIDAQQVRTDPFGKNRVAERVYRRVERIVAALYLITRHIPETDPLSSEIRTEGISLLDKTLNLRDEMRVPESAKLASFEVSVRKLISLARVLTAAGRVSFQNADTIIGALDELTVFIASSQRSTLSESASISREDIVGDTSPLHDRNTLKDIRDSRRTIKDRADIPVSQTSSVAARAQGIVSILRAGGELGIKDIATRLPDYSEKMIQRELAALIKAGQVKKEGLKRWSRYSLVQ